MKTLLLLKGDGIGPEIVDATMTLWEALKERYALSIEVEEAFFGGAAIEACGKAFPKETKERVERADAVLLGAVGGPKWDHLAREERPESALLALRKQMNVFSNLRFIRCYDFLADRLPFKEEHAQGVEFIICRELTGGIYFGEKGRDKDKAWDTLTYHEHEIRRIVQQAFRIAEQRPRKKLTSIDKANVLESSRLWRKIVEEEAQYHPTVEVEHLYIDNASLQVVLNPQQFDVIVTENAFGDILSDECACYAGSLGMLPSASLGEKSGLYEPIHGSAPDLAGKNIANPVGTVLSLALALRYSLDAPEAADALVWATIKALQEGIRTIDIAEPGKAYSTTAMVEGIQTYLKAYRK